MGCQDTQPREGERRARRRRPRPTGWPLLGVVKSGNSYPPRHPFPFCWSRGRRVGALQWAARFVLCRTRARAAVRCDEATRERCLCVIDDTHVTPIYLVPRCVVTRRAFVQTRGDTRAPPPSSSSRVTQKKWFDRSIERMQWIEIETIQTRIDRSIDRTNASTWFDRTNRNVSRSIKSTTVCGSIRDRVVRRFDPLDLGARRGVRVNDRPERSCSATFAVYHYNSVHYVVPLHDSISYHLT